MGLGGSECQGHPQLYTKFEISLSSMRPWLKNNENVTSVQATGWHLYQTQDPIPLVFFFFWTEIEPKAL